MFATCQQNDINSILAYSISSFVVYSIYILKRPKLGIVFAVGLIARLIILPSFPGLSDDIYRFIWDGRLTSNGINPYSFLPSEILPLNLSGLGPDLYSELNSPNYYTIYPPVSQLVFWVSTWFGEELMTSNLVMKIIFILCEILTFLGIIKILKHIQSPSYYAIVYWLNPLIIIEGTGNLHFEIIMISFLVWGIYFLFVNQNIKWGAMFFSLSIAIKLLPLLLLPYMMFRFESKKRKQFFIYLFGFVVVLFLPILWGHQLLNFGASMDLYFQKFEYNASIYYILRYLGKLISGYNLIYYIGPLLAIITIVVILKFASMDKVIDVISFVKFSLASFMVYLICATTVHPWYICLPIFLSVFDRNMYVLVWSAIIIWTYINYSYPIFDENIHVVVFEYFVVFLLLLYHLRTKRRNTSEHKMSI